MIVLSLVQYSHVFAFPLICVCFFLSSMYGAKKMAGSTRSKFLLLNWLFTLLLVVSTFTGGFPSSVVYLLTSWAVSLLGLTFADSTRKPAYILIVASLGLTGGSYFIPASDFAYKNRNARTTFAHPDILFLTEDYDTLRIDPEVVTVLDNWHVYCGPCFKKFPHLNELYLDYADNPKVEVYALNSPQRFDHPDSVRALMSGLNYDFPQLYAVDIKALQAAFKFNSYPHLLILKGGRVHYSGFFGTGWNQPSTNPREIINTLAETEAK